MRPETSHLTEEDLRFVLGLKLKGLRRERDLTLQQLAGRAGLSVSYISEIEKGKKYPKPEKLLSLAGALGVAYEDLVSPQVAEELAPVKTVFSSDFLQGFPFELFGVDPEDLFGIATGRPERVAALIRALLDVGRTHDIQVEDFLLAALRSYQQLNHNYFPHLEDAAIRCRADHGWPEGQAPTLQALTDLLTQRHGYRIDRDTLPNHPDLRTFRSVYLDGRPPRLLLNGRLMPSQQSFVLARELGYRYLGLTGQRALTSSWIQVESFEQVLNNFYASYFAGALLIDRDHLIADLHTLFRQPTWDPAALAALLARYDVTPELFFHRLTELLPQHLHLPELFFLRFAHHRLTKFLNTSHIPIPHALGPAETYCRRWPALRLLNHPHPNPHPHPHLTAPTASTAPTGPTAPTAPAARTAPTAPTAEKLHFPEGTFLVLTIARPLSLSADATSSVSLGLLLDPNHPLPAFQNDPAIPQTEVNLSCERCPLTDCQDRAAPPTRLHHHQSQLRKQSAIASLQNPST